MHTPGPWFYHDHKTRTAQITNSPTGIDSGLRIADVWATDLPGGVENAHLIAAAPAMLEALEIMVREFGQFGRKLNVKKDFHKLVAIEAARTAIEAAQPEA